MPWVWGALAGPGAQSEKPELVTPPAATPSSQTSPYGSGDGRHVHQVFRIRDSPRSGRRRSRATSSSALRVPHYTLEAYGFRISQNGVRLAYSGDSGPSEQLPEIARDCDLFVCEATLLDPEPGLRGHLTLPEAEEAFEQSGARRLLLTHRRRSVPPTASTSSPTRGSRSCSRETIESIELDREAAVPVDRLLPAVRKERGHLPARGRDDVGVHGRLVEAEPPQVAAS